MLVPLRNAFIAGFSGAYSTGALVCFLVTVSEISWLGISAPFWGIVFGCLVAWLMDATTKKSAVVEDSSMEESSIEEDAARMEAAEEREAELRQTTRT